MGHTTPEEPILRFGVFDLDLETGELFKAGIRQRLQPQPFKVLALLARQPDRLLTREEIKARIWGQAALVDAEHGLNFCIKEIRSALGDDPQAPRFVETLPRRGYRFIAPVERVSRVHEALEHPGASAVARRPHAREGGLLAAAVIIATSLGAAAYLGWLQPRADPDMGAGRIFLAVLPFDDLSTEQDQKYLSDGLTEEIITQLARLRPERLGVIARTSAMQYAETDKTVDQIGHELGVDYVLEGAVRRVDDRVRVNVQLLRVADQSHVWAESYLQDFQDMLALEAGISQAVVDEIGGRLNAEAVPSYDRPSLNPEAYEAYLKGRYHWNRLTSEGAQRAIAYFEQAIEYDSSFAAPYAGLADAFYALSNMQLDPQEAMVEAKTAALRALALDSTSSEAHVSLGLVKAFYEWDWAGASEAFERAIALSPGAADPHEWHGVFLATMGRIDRSISKLEQARRLDPLSPGINVMLGFPLLLAGRHDDAIQQMMNALELDEDFYRAYAGLGQIYEMSGELEKAVASYETAHELYDSPELLAFLGRAYALAGDTAQACRVLDELQTLAKERYVSPYDLAVMYTALDENHRALDLLWAAYESRAEGMVGLKVDPRLERLRSDPRFQDLLRRMRFPL